MNADAAALLGALLALLGVLALVVGLLSVAGAGAAALDRTGT